MISISGYTIETQVEATANRTSYRGLRLADHRPVLIQVYSTSHATAADIVRFKHEYRKIQAVRSSGLLYAQALVDLPDGIALVLDDFSGRSLGEPMLPGPPDLPAFLGIARAATRALADLHGAGIAHLALAPARILWDPVGSRIKLADFGVTRLLTHELEGLHDPGVIAASLPYLAPEQTGRVRRQVDHRADFYALGATLYRLLTGHPPFASSDPLELIHQHLAKTPASPAEVSPGVPAAISDIIMRLLAKEAERRYQTCQGLESDWAACQSRLEKTGRIDSFELGSRDRPTELSLPQRLYGRDAEVTAIQEAWERASQGGAELVLVSGPPGIGKTSVIDEVEGPVVQRKGRFLHGRFESLTRDTPYAGIVQAFGGLIRTLLTESDEHVRAGKAALREAIGADAQVLVDVLPEAVLLVGSGVPLAPLGPAESRHRFELTFERFVRVFARPEHPVALFLDNLQSADPASLRLIVSLLANGQVRNLLVLGAYRDGLPPDHAILAGLEGIRTAGVRVSELHLDVLDPAAVNRLVADALSCPPEAARPLAELVGARTGNNPLFAREFLRLLRESRVLDRDTSGGWHWDLEAARLLPVAKSVLDLLAGQISRLSAAARSVLTIAACIGAGFSLDLLAAVRGNTVEETLAALSEAMEGGLIYLWGESYHFVHNRIHEAAYALLTDDERASFHHRIGTVALARESPQTTAEPFFVVDQLNAGRAHVRDAAQKADLARLNLSAGQRAQGLAAYASAAGYLRCGLDLLPPGAWRTSYALTADLYLGLAECEFITGNYDRAEKLFDTALLNLRTRRQRARVYRLKASMYALVYRTRDALRASMDGLALLRVKVPYRWPLPAMLWELLLAKLRLWGKRPSDLAALPVITEPGQVLAGELCMQVAIAAYTIPDAILSNWALLLLVNASLRLGHTPDSAEAFIGYGLLHVVLGDYRTGYEMGRFALGLGEAFSRPDVTCVTTGLFGGMINHWRAPATEGPPYMQQCVDLGYATGNVEYLRYITPVLVASRLFLGHDLELVYRDCVTYSERLRRYSIPQNDLQQHRQVVLSLRGLTRSPAGLSDDSYDEEAEAGRLRRSEHAPPWVIYCVLKSLLCYLHGRYEEALRMAMEAERHPQALPGLLYVPLHTVSYALTLAALIPAAPAGVRVGYRARLAGLLRRTRRWAVSCPANFRAFERLISAEVARLDARPARAMALYEQAIRAADTGGYPNFAAMAAEAASRFYLSQGLDTVAWAYLGQARAGYLSWGAISKVRDLDERYPTLVPRPSEGPLRASGSLDLVTVVKACQTLSEEMVFDRLLSKLMSIMMESAGAERGLLVLERQERLLIEASASAEHGGVSLLRSVPVEESPDLPLALVKYVQRTGEPLVLHDAGSEGLFVNDPYVLLRRPRSILCLPILKQTRLVGLLYLENNLTSHAFTSERVQVLGVLAAQAAISLENTQLYNELELRVQQRTSELESARKQAEQLATTDQLTGVYNRRGLMEASEREARLADRSGRPLSVITFDLDHFKQVNDRLGHAEGDRVLREVALAVRRTIRSTDLFGRMGGEEFLLVLPDTTRSGAVLLAERVRSRLEREITVDDPPRAVTASFGVSWAAGGPVTVELLQAAADAALYRAKGGGRNCVVTAGGVGQGAPEALTRRSAPQ